MMPAHRSGSTLPPMPCLIALLALLSPRLALFFVWIFSDVLSRAYSSWIIPLLGFFLLPWTTLVYAGVWHWAPAHHLNFFDWLFVALAFFLDVASYAGGRFARGRG
jgi:hypothetical protein